MIHGGAPLTGDPRPTFHGAIPESPLPRFSALAARALAFGLAGAVVLAASPPVLFAADHLLLTEFAVRPTDAEFVEIFNPTAQPIDLTNVYLSDYVLASNSLNNYWHVVDGALVPDSAFPNDFLARFPDGATILPGESIVVALHDDALFSGFWSEGTSVAVPDYEMIQDGGGDGVPDMVDPGPALIGAPYIQSQAGLSNDREVVVMFRWDGLSDLVQDLDVVQWSNAGPAFNTLSPNKTGVSVDGPDPDEALSSYLPDTSPQGQDLASAATGAHDIELTVARINFQEGTERLEGGNGVTGHDETSENLSATWQANSIASIGSPGDFGPPALLAGLASTETEIVLVFSRALDPVTASDPANYHVTLVQTPAGGIASAPLPVRGARLDADPTRVLLATDPQIAAALYEVEASNVASADGTEVLTPGSRVFVRGYNPGPGIRLDVPLRPFVPHLDRQLEISYLAPQGEPILLRVFDARGRELFVMADELSPPGGLKTIRWDGRDDLRQVLPAGMYFLHLELSRTGDETVAPLVVAVASEGTLR